MYISTMSMVLSKEEVRAIGRHASRNNRKLGVTGILLSAHEFFFQILEGESRTVDRLIERISRDPRHQDLLILKGEEGSIDRLFPNWSMRTVRLDDTNDLILQAIRIMLENIVQSHRIIERYTQPSVLQFLAQGVNPLEIPVKKVDQIVCFADMLGFSYLSQRFPVDEVAEVVNAYLDRCSKRVSEYGGEVTKYIGDGVVAHFPPEQADDAIAACLQILSDLEGLRETAHPCRLMRLLFCGFGLSLGQVIKGNIGSTIKMDYTVLGDTVNLAARLEALTRTIRRALAMDERVCHNARCAWPFEYVGEFALKGRERPCAVFSLDDPRVNQFKAHDELIREMELVCQL